MQHLILYRHMTVIIWRYALYSWVRL